MCQGPAVRGRGDHEVHGFSNCSTTRLFVTTDAIQTTTYLIGIHPPIQTEMARILTIPRELRDEILRLVIETPTAYPQLRNGNGEKAVQPNNLSLPLNSTFGAFYQRFHRPLTR
jgi:hypothetical protein